MKACILAVGHKQFLYMFCVWVHFLTGIEILWPMRHMLVGRLCMCAWTHPHISGHPLEKIKGQTLVGFPPCQSQCWGKCLPRGAQPRLVHVDCESKTGRIKMSGELSLIILVAAFFHIVYKSSSFCYVSCCLTFDIVTFCHSSLRATLTWVRARFLFHHQRL